jgi:hypothetical protein
MMGRVKEKRKSARQKGNRWEDCSDPLYAKELFLPEFEDLELSKPRELGQWARAAD